MMIVIGKKDAYLCRVERRGKYYVIGIIQKKMEKSFFFGLLKKQVWATVYGSSGYGCNAVYEYNEMNVRQRMEWFENIVNEYETKMEGMEK